MSLLEQMPTSVRERYADLLLRTVYQLGGRGRYVPFVELEDELGIEPDVLYGLISEDLVAEVHFALRLPAELEASLEFAAALERAQAREDFSAPHVRVRPNVARRTLDELTSGHPRRKRRWKIRLGESHRRLPQFVAGP